MRVNKFHPLEDFSSRIGEWNNEITNFINK
jgi:hypothetical protein